MKQRTEEKLYNQYFKNFFSKKKGEADGDAFWKLVEAMSERFKFKMENQTPVRNNEYILDRKMRGKLRSNSKLTKI